MSAVRAAPIRLPNRRMMASSRTSLSSGEDFLDRDRINMILIGAGALLFVFFAVSFYQDLAKDSSSGKAGVAEVFTDTRF